ncbi:MAG: hypothetical protein GY771_00580 [bacterium]|nr:hypothetical protein [bacterium]
MLNNRDSKSAVYIAAVALLFSVSSLGQPETESTNERHCPESAMEGTPEYLAGFPTDGLYARDSDGDIIRAPEIDTLVAQEYPLFEDKGPLKGGMRITILTAKSEYEAGEEVRVIHILDAPRPGVEVYVMGPKPIREEYINGEPATPPAEGIGIYNGRVLQSPHADYNYDVSVYTFDEPGEYSIQWKGGGANGEDIGLESNVLNIIITD